MLEKLAKAADQEDRSGRYEIADTIDAIIRLAVAQHPNQDMTIPNIQTRMKQLEQRLVSMDQKYTTLLAKLEKQLGPSSGLPAATEPNISQEQILDAVTPDGSTTPQFNMTGGADIKVTL